MQPEREVTIRAAVKHAPLESTTISHIAKNMTNYPPPPQQYLPKETPFQSFHLTTRHAHSHACETTHQSNIFNNDTTILNFLAFPRHTLIHLKAGDFQMVKMRMNSDREGQILDKPTQQQEKNDSQKSGTHQSPHWIQPVMSNSHQSRTESQKQELYHNKHQSQFQSHLPLPLFESFLCGQNGDSEQDPSANNDRKLLSPDNLHLKLYLMDPVRGCRAEIPYLVHEVVSAYEVVLLVTFAMCEKTIWNKCEFNEFYYNRLANYMDKTPASRKAKAALNVSNGPTQPSLLPPEDMYRSEGHIQVTFTDRFRGFHCEYTSPAPLQILIRESHLNFLLQLNFETPSLELMDVNHPLRVANWERRWGQYRVTPSSKNSSSDEAHPVRDTDEITNVPSLPSTTETDDPKNLSDKQQQDSDSASNAAQSESQLIESASMQQSEAATSPAEKSTRTPNSGKDRENTATPSSTRRRIKRKRTTTHPAKNAERTGSHSPEATTGTVDENGQPEHNSTTTKAQDGELQVPEKKRRKTDNAVELYEQFTLKQRPPQQQEDWSKWWHQQRRSTVVSKAQLSIEYSEEQDEEISWIDPEMGEFYDLVREETLGS